MTVRRMAATGSKAAALIRIAITEAAFAGIKTALPFSNTGYESSCSAGGGYFIWLDRRTRDTRSMQGACRGRLFRDDHQTGKGG